MGLKLVPLVWLFLAAAILSTIVVVLATGGGTHVTISDGHGVSGQTVRIGVRMDSTPTSIKAFQINFTVDETAITNVNVVEGADFPEWLLNCHFNPGDLRCVAIDLTADGIIVNGEIMVLNFQLASDAPISTLPISAGLVDVLSIDDDFTSIELIEGTLLVGLCGDVALPPDGLVTIADVIATMEALIGLIEFTPAQFTFSDVSQDGLVNILDAVQIVEDVVGKVEISECGVSS